MGTPPAAALNCGELGRSGAVIAPGGGPCLRISGSAQDALGAGDAGTATDAVSRSIKSVVVQRLVGQLIGEVFHKGVVRLFDHHLGHRALRPGWTGICPCELCGAPEKEVKPTAVPGGGLPAVTAPAQRSVTGRSKNTGQSKASGIRPPPYRE